MLIQILVITVAYSICCQGDKLATIRSQNASLYAIQ